MLNFLQIRNYAIVDSLDLEFSAGFTCITGETGAGKSILVGALGLLCGNRADTSAIRSGADRAELNAEFELPPDSPALSWLREAELDDGSICLLRRTISVNGRSRSWINGTAITLQQLSELGELLVEIHGQNEHIRLVRSTEQFRLLDGGGSHDDDLERLKTSFDAWQALEREKQELLDETPLDPGEFDLLQYQINELEESMIPAEEFREMEQEHRKLAHGGELVEALEFAIQSLDSSQAIHRAAEQLEPRAPLDEDIATALGLLREADINCDEAMRSLQAARSRLDLSPERLSRLERQLSAQHDLARKHRVEPEQLAETLAQLKERLERAGSLEKRLEQIEKELESALQDYRQSALKLHHSRAARADDLATAVTELMQELGMEGGRFEFDIRHDPESKPSARGSDQLELKVSANPGTTPGPLRKVASGGELSRISLAIKVAARTGAAAATQVFDEVDAGIGGEIASAVGTLLKGLSANGQALCVTHLAQVAIFADQQMQVYKSSDELETRVETSLLAEQARIDEIARMLGGKLTEQSRAHASELLATAATRH
jgi:DNA repair protein RecN (Recombination protein N)